MDYTKERMHLVQRLKEEGILHAQVLAAIAQTPRHLFVPPTYLEQAYHNIALPIEHFQTISQPYIVARMTELMLGKKKHLNKVLEIGTGSGYQTAILAQVVNEVYTIERIEALLLQAQERLKALSIKNVHMLYGDGNLGWEMYGPYDGIIVTAGAAKVPKALRHQLANDGRLIIPVHQKEQHQRLLLIVRQGNTFSTTKYEPVSFVPLRTGTSAT